LPGNGFWQGLQSDLAQGALRGSILASTEPRSIPPTTQGNGHIITLIRRAKIWRPSNFSRNMGAAVDGSPMHADLDNTMMSVGHQTQLHHLLGGSRMRFSCPHSIVRSPDRLNDRSRTTVPQHRQTNPLHLDSTGHRCTGCRRALTFWPPDTTVIWTTLDQRASHKSAAYNGDARQAQRGRLRGTHLGLSIPMISARSRERHHTVNT
jgi:hypothetical protein